MATRPPEPTRPPETPLPPDIPGVRLDFIRQIVADDFAAETWGGNIITRFPPEPNGYLHIGHAKSLCLNFGIPREFADQATGNARCHMRFDDTNPTKEEDHYVQAILKDVQWLDFDWGDHLYFSSDYFQQLYDWAVQLIHAGKAYVDDQTPDEIRQSRGSLTTPGTESPYRNRSVEENLDLFTRMHAGEFPDGAKVLRAKIDMACGNLNMRDPVMYRILRATHHRTGDTWCIYPTYDFTHGQSDAIEGVTHSLCTLEFEDHRPLYDWYLQALGFEGPPRKPRQIEFAKMNISYTMLSKRNLLRLVEEGHVNSWDDPRMPTLSGMRRRGFTPQAIRNFCKTIGIAKRENVIEVELLQHCLREDLNKQAQRRMAVLNPLKVVLTNYPEGEVEMRDAQNNPEDPDAGKRQVPFSRELYIERDDFMEDPPKKFFRLGPGREVRLRFGYFIKCEQVIKNDAGEIVELRCTYDPETSGGKAPDGRKVKGTIHWVSAARAVDAQVRLYDHLFNKLDPYDAPEDTDGQPNWRENLNPNSLTVVKNAKLEPSLADAEPGTAYQFERVGYFCVDANDSKPDALAFNRTVSLKDAWAKLQKKS